jgi:hypothetical protein
LGSDDQVDSGQQALGMLSEVGAADLLLARVDALQPLGIAFAAPVPCVIGHGQTGLHVQSAC